MVGLMVIINDDYRYYYRIFNWILFNYLWIEAVMNNNIKSEKFRGLSITALVTSILAIGLIGIVISPLFFFLNGVIANIFLFSSPVWSIVAVVCGSIDLKRVQAGRYSNKGRGFDITGI